MPLDNLRIDGDRLWRSLMEMAEIGATPKGGVCRLALTDLDRQGRDLFRRWAEEAGCTVAVDAVGNMFARRPGRDASRPAVMTGSHLDSQPTGGKFDGAYGVLAGLEVLRTLNDLGLETEAPLEVVVWTNEEGSRYAPAMMGSGAYAGVFSEEETLAKTDEEGVTFGEALDAIGYRGEGLGGRPVAAYFEAHIEQGPILEAEEKTIGVVTDGQGQRWYNVAVTGRESHAGTTPMPLRKDALVAAARIVDAVHRIAHDQAPQAVGTVGVLTISEASRNVIPGRVDLTVDFRHPDDAVLATMDRALHTAAQAIAAELDVEAAIEPIWHFPPVKFDADCVDAVRKAAEDGGYAWREIVSGAGHDACYTARRAPTSMVFVPCENGISHNEIENATMDDCAAGANVLLHAMLTRANA